MTNTADAAPFSRPFAWERVQPKGTTVTLDASEQECAALAEIFGILTVKSVHAELVVAPWRRNGYRVSGEVTASVEQACVVTLDPVAEEVREQVEVTFLPPSEIVEPEGEEIAIDVEAEDPPEAIDGPTVDLGILAAEFVAIGLDPYPRKPGVEFTPFIEDDGSSDGDQPFAGLAALKTPGT